MTLFTAVLIFLGLQATCLATKTIQGPLLSDDFPSPSIIKVNNAYYAFSSRDYRHDKTINTPIATSKSLLSGWTLLDQDALPFPGSWVDQKHPSVLTPDIDQLADGSFILYYIAVPKSDALREHCIGAATSPNVTGPFKPQDKPLLCPPQLGRQGVGTAGPNGFVFENQRYIVFKNASGHDAQHTSYIDIVPVGADGYTSQGAWTELIHSTSADHNDVEGPAIVRNPGGGFVLFFGAGEFNTTSLHIEYATADKLLGPYERQGVLLQSGTYDGVDISAPLGPDFVSGDPYQMTFEAFGTDKGHRIRQMYVATLTYNGNKVALA